MTQFKITRVYTDKKVLLFDIPFGEITSIDSSLPAISEYDEGNITCFNFGNWFIGQHVIESRLWLIDCNHEKREVGREENILKYIKFDSWKNFDVCQDFLSIPYCMIDIQSSFMDDAMIKRGNITYSNDYKIYEQEIERLKNLTNTLRKQNSSLVNEKNAAVNKFEKQKRKILNILQN